MPTVDSRRGDQSFTQIVNNRQSVRFTLMLRLVFLIAHPCQILVNLSNIMMDHLVQKEECLLDHQITTEGRKNDIARDYQKVKGSGKRAKKGELKQIIERHKMKRNLEDADIPEVMIRMRV